MSSIRWWLQRDPALLMPAPRLGRRRVNRNRHATLPEPSGHAPADSSSPRGHAPDNSFPPQRGEAGRVAHGLAFPDAAHLWLTFSGTAALFAAAQALGLEPGDGVLFPAYNCGHEIEPFLRRGIRPAFYRVGPGLRVEPDDVERQIRGETRAVLLTHYFGFPQDTEAIRAVCDRHGLLLIEDCAHALLSADRGRPLGSHGDAAVFSLRKSLPLTDGGALLLRAAPAGPSPGLYDPPRLPVALKRIELWKKRLLQASTVPGWALSRAALVTLAPVLSLRDALEARDVGGPIPWYDPDYEEFDFPDDVLSWRMSGSATAALAGFDPAAIRAARRAHYTRLAEQIRSTPGVTLLPELPRETCPLFLPLWVERPQQVVARLQADGISAAPWWELFHPKVPWGEYPEATELKHKGIVLPIHQSLETRHIDRAARSLERVLRGSRKSAGRA